MVFYFFFVLLQAHKKDMNSAKDKKTMGEQGALSSETVEHLAAPGEIFTRFGVQSPSAYQFIRYVLTEHYPYYA